LADTDGDGDLDLHLSQGRDEGFLVNRLVNDGKGVFRVLESEPLTRKNPPKPPVPRRDKVPPPKPLQGRPIELVTLPGGEFLMGSPRTQKGRARDRMGTSANYYTDREPLHPVWITRPFKISATEVTQAQWIDVMKTCPWRGKPYVKEGPDYPAVYITWWDANEFCVRLGQREKAKYRLPTEAEWEYACRAGGKGSFCSGDEAKGLGGYAWFRDNAAGRGKDHPRRVAMKKPNAWGLYDMHGNAWEWCFDYMASVPKGRTVDPMGPKNGLLRICRGGSWGCEAAKCRCAFRSSEYPDYPYRSMGFRIVREIGTVEERGNR
jgi:formylglycine-generating enzyme required for sulfatase activity